VPEIRQKAARFRSEAHEEEALQVCDAITGFENQETDPVEVSELLGIRIEGDESTRRDTTTARRHGESMKPMRIRDTHERHPVRAGQVKRMIANHIVAQEVVAPARPHGTLSNREERLVLMDGNSRELKVSHRQDTDSAGWEPAGPML
jgi:hypothetical protein